MQNLFPALWIALGVVSLGLIGYGFYRSASYLYWKVVICLLPVLLSTVVVARAVGRYEAGKGGFKLGVDLVGGTILVYEVDPDKQKARDYSKELLAQRLKSRLDPNDLYNITIRPIGENRVEIILPTGGVKQAQQAQAAWNESLSKIQDRYNDKLQGEKLDVPRGKVDDLNTQIFTKIRDKQWARALAALVEKYPALKDNAEFKAVEVGQDQALITAAEKGSGAQRSEVEAIVKANYQPEALGEIKSTVKGIAGEQRADLTSEEIETLKRKIRQVGNLEFRILANRIDDEPAMAATEKYFNGRSDAEIAALPDADRAKATTEREQLKRDLELRAQAGQLPPLPAPPEGAADWPTTREGLGRQTYQWVELGKGERLNLGLNNDARGSQLWVMLETARTQNRVYFEQGRSILLYSRVCTNGKLSREERDAKKFEYFVLTRRPQPGQEVTGADLIDAAEDRDEYSNRAVRFAFNSQGASRFGDLTRKNTPSNNFKRLLSIILDDYVESAPSVNTAITGGSGIITSGTKGYTQEEVDDLVSVLRSGALPATLKPLPVSENTIGPTLGQDTIDRGLMSVALAFGAVLLFMIVYYRFAGFVASTALLANLLLTVAFMVAVNATFTLPGLAGLVLMLGMAVDANVLIYERLREERDKGASLLQALRNGYDRALPAIIDTHLTSIFTAIVLYVVGNDQLKGFGVSLASGLIISLFTSLFMTRTMFDLWVKAGWLTQLGMFRFLTKPRIDFMRIRHYWFAATAILTIFGVTVFFIRGDRGLNIDFVGGTAMSAQLKSPIGIKDLREKLSEEQQKNQLAVDKVEQTDDEGRRFRITYKAGAGATDREQKVTLVNPAPGASNAEREQFVATRASHLPDWSVEQIFLASEANTGGESRYFTVRTTEKEPDLVLVTVNRLMRNESGYMLAQVLLSPPIIESRTVRLEFSEPASPGFVKVLLDREFGDIRKKDAEGKVVAPLKGAAFEVFGEGEQAEGRYRKMRVDLTAPAFGSLTPDELSKIFEQTREEFQARPQPLRLENFDKQLAADTQLKALYAILASWVAILLYLWFRFGSWAFGAAAVICLAHDLLFTLGIIAFCHYVVDFAPGVASFLKIEDFKIDLPAVAALLTLVGYSVNDTIVVFDRIREVRGKNPLLTSQMINDSINQTLSRTLLASTTVFLVVAVLYWFGGEGVHLFGFVMMIGVIVGTYSSIYIASPLLLIFGEGNPQKRAGGAPQTTPAPTTV